MAAHQHLLYHIVFSTKERRPLLQEDGFREEVWAYMAAVCKNLGGVDVGSSDSSLVETKVAILSASMRIICWW